MTSSLQELHVDNKFGHVSKTLDLDDLGHSMEDLETLEFFKMYCFGRATQKCDCKSHTGYELTLGVGL